MHDNLKMASMDRHLEEKANISSKELAKYRWHWTLNKDNPDRVSMAEYGRLTGRTFSIIRLYARAYALSYENPAWPFHECMERAHHSENRQTVIEEIVNQFGRTWSSVRQREGAMVREVTTRAQALAEDMNITFPDAVKDTVGKLKASAERREFEQQTLAENHGIRFVSVENELVKAHNALHKALIESRNVEFADREVEMLNDTVRKIASITQLLDYALSGNIDVDWDKELEKLDRGVA